MKPTLLLLCALFANEAFACSCLRPDVARMEKEAEFVVLAQLKKHSTLIGSRKHVFSTIKTFKGAANEQLAVRTAMFEVSCGLRVRRDVPYVLFVYREGDKLMVDHCSSWPLTRDHFLYTAAFNDYYGLVGTDALEPNSKEPVDNPETKPSG